MIGVTFSKEPEAVSHSTAPEPYQPPCASRTWEVLYGVIQPATTTAGIAPKGKIHIKAAIWEEIKS